MEKALRVFHLGDRRKALLARDVSDFAPKWERIVAGCHPKQRDLVLDRSRRIVARVPRRGGKTTAIAYRGVRVAHVRDGRFLYAATSRLQAEDLIWIPLKELNDEYKLGLQFNETKFTVRNPKTRGLIQVVGIDDKHEVEKQRGKKFHEAWVDEAAHHQPALLEYFVYQVLEPALADYGGVLGLTGTPKHILAGLFFELTRPGSELSRLYEDREAFAGIDLWSLHTWTQRDNDRVHRPECSPGCVIPHIWEESLRNKAANGWSDQHPIWTRESLGQWAADNTENVYKYRPFLDDGSPWNQWDPKRLPGGFADLEELPKGHTWRFVYGMDMGHSDPFALQVFAYSDTHRTLFHVFEFEKTKMYAKTIAEVLLGPERNVEKPSGVIGRTGWPDGMSADTAGLGDALLEELAQVYGLRIDAAEKKNKHDAIELFNGDLIDGHVKILKGSKLEEQLQGLQWDVDDAGRLKEHKKQRNDCTDAAIYARRKAKHKFAQDPPPPRKPKTWEQREQEAEDQAANPRDEFSIRGDESFDSFFRDDL